MLKRYRNNLDTPYGECELRDIYTVSRFLHVRYSSGDRALSDLEKDYLLYCKQVFWQNTKYTNVVACLNFVVIDMLPPINRFKFFTRWGIKLFSSLWVVKQGINLAYLKILEFPLMNEVIGEAIIKYTDWVDISK